MKKIAIFQYDLNVGGIQKSLINLLNNIDMSKYEIDLYLFKHGNFYETSINPKINIHYLKSYNYFNRIVFFDILKTFHKSKISKEYDVTIDFNSYSNECAVNAIKTKSKQKYIFAHNDVILKNKFEIKYKILTFFFRGKYKYFDKIIAVSEGVKESINKKYKIENEKIIVMPNYIDTDEILEKSKNSHDIRIDNNNYNLVSVGRMEKQKGYDITVNLMKDIVSKNKNIKLYIIGDGKERKKIEKLINKYNLNNNIILLGKKNNPYSIMKDMDALLLTSRYEGQGMVLLEAKTLGLDLFLPKHLEKYNKGIVGNDNLEEIIIKSKKKNKVIDKLEEYNKEIIKTFEKLLNMDVK